MITKSIEQSVNRPTEAQKQRKAAPFRYYFYCEILKIFRDPWAVVFGVGFPTLFFLIFGTSLYAKYASGLLAQYAAYGAFVAAFQIFSISIATERGKGWDKLLRTTSLSAALSLGTKFLVVMCTGIISLLLLFAVAALSGKVHMALATWLALLGSMILGMIPFALAGIFLGFIGTPNLSQVLGTVLTLLLSFTSGLYVPLQIMPDFIRALAPYLPTYHLTQIAWYAVGSSWSRDTTPFWLHVVLLCGFAIVFLLLAFWAYVRDAQENFA